MSTKNRKRPPTQGLNDATLSHESWKIFQVVSEFVEGYERLYYTRPCISVFGSARFASDHHHYQGAYALSRILSESGWSVITGGGPGVMEAANKGAFEGPAYSIGLNMELHNQENANPYQDISLRFRHFFTRKIMFFKYTSAFIVFPGGFGTLDEVVEALDLIKTRKTRRVPIILIDKAFWQGMVDWFSQTLLTEGMIYQEEFELFTVVDTYQEALQVLEKELSMQLTWPQADQD